MKKTTIILLVTLLVLFTSINCALSAEEEKFKVGFIYNGPVEDHGWAYQLDQGREYVENNLDNVTTTYVDNVPETADAERVIHQMVGDRNLDMFIATSFGYKDYIKSVARDYPEVIFENYDTYETGDNIGSYRIRIDQPFYLAGMAAGAVTETDKLGFVGAFPVPQVVRHINAFTLGAQEVNPDVEVRVLWVNSWADPGLEREAANSLIEVGADVLAHHQSGASVVSVAEDNNIYSVGYSVDQSGFAPEGHLVSVYFQWGYLFEDLVRSAMEGTWETGEKWWNIDSEAGTISDFGKPVDDELKEKILTRKKEIAREEFKIFSGPIENRDGEVIVKEGEILDLDSRLSMDWFVKGVKGSLEN